MTVRIITKSIWSNPGNRGQRLRRTAYAIAWQFWKRSVRRPITLTLANGRQFISHPDCVVSSALVYSHFPEFHELQFLRRQLCGDDVVIDVGANVGHIGLLLSDLVDPASILAFEPTPITFRRLCENWQINGFPIEGLYQVALGGQEGSVSFPDLAHPSTMNARVTGDSAGNVSVAHVRLHLLDRYRELWKGRSLGLLKVDVEGYEADVFRGARQTLRNDRPRLIMFESLSGMSEPTVEAELREANYCLFQLDHQGCPSEGPVSNQNLFAAPAERFHQLISP
jgi:FkbM family methyltransferase